MLECKIFKMFWSVGKMKIGFVILHYQVMKMTQKCVRSIKKFVSDAVIVIVDNNSPDNSGKELQKIYENDNDIICILNTENIGFARGNNIGYKYLKNNYNCDYICCINNDTLITDRHFSEKVEQEYKRSNFAVLAPQARRKNYTIQNFDYHISSLQDYENLLQYYESDKTLTDYMKRVSKRQFLLFKYPALNMLLKFYYEIRKSDGYMVSYKEPVENIMLPGCFLIFSKVYIDIFDSAFDKRTFLYREEDLLYLRLKHYHLKSVYLPTLHIRHKENSSTNMLISNNEEKYQFSRKNQINSLKIIVQILKNEISIEDGI